MKKTLTLRPLFLLDTLKTVEEVLDEQKSEKKEKQKSQP